MAKITRILLVLAVALGLMIGSIGSVFAAEPSLVSVLSITGTVVEKGKISNDGPKLAIKNFCQKSSLFCLKALPFKTFLT